MSDATGAQCLASGVRHKNAFTPTMWARYRLWKHALVFPLVILTLLLMRGEPEASPRWYIGMGVAALLGIVYLVEEIVWIAQHRGRPCAECGQRIHLRPFSVRIRCPHCGRLLE